MDDYDATKVSCQDVRPPKLLFAMRDLRYSQNRSFDFDYHTSAVQRTCEALHLLASVKISPAGAKEAATATKIVGEIMVTSAAGVLSAGLMMAIASLRTSTQSLPSNLRIRLFGVPLWRRGRSNNCYDNIPLINTQ